MKAFIDLGSHKGKAIAKFMASSEYSPEWEIHAFDPNPYLLMDYPERVIKHRLGAWIEDGEFNFYVNTKKVTGGGSSLLKEKQSGRLNKEQSLIVRCINIGLWIKNRYKKNDMIIIKMDIEGAEYKVLESMLADGSLEYVDRIYIDVHSKKALVNDDYSEALLARVRNVTDVFPDYIESTKIKAGKIRWYDTRSQT